MKALVKYGMGENDIELRDIPEPIPKPNEVKVKVEATGICGTDLYGYSAIKPPVVLGHETAGIVVEVGEEVKDIRIGDRVTTETTAYICGKCRYCQNKEYNLCEYRKGLGSSVNGAFAEYFVIRKESIHQIPSHLDFISASLFEPLSCATHSVMEQANLLKGEVALILGPGPFGLLIAQVAQALGARVIIVGIEGDEKRLSLAKNLGIDLIFKIEKKDLEEDLSNIIIDNDIDVVFECSGSITAIKYGLKMIRKGGRFIQAGIVRVPIELDFNELLFNKELLLIGSRTQKPSSWDKAIQLVDKGKVNLGKLVSDVLPLSDWKEGFKKAKEKNSIKVVLQTENIK
ncbi:MAG TPA: sorbitol dehydrogenase [Candidatus Atribacteria bacterium]|nr:sorbitol dehydrogenase [Candidatus Atribacteria bacterium]